MLNVKIKFKGCCPLHPRYDPADGERGIKANCSACWALCDVYMIAQKLENCIRDAKARLEPKT
jgi:hypothetical protein